MRTTINRDDQLVTEEAQRLTGFRTEGANGELGSESRIGLPPC